MFIRKNLFKALGVFMALAMLLALLPAGEVLAAADYTVGEGDDFLTVLADCTAGETIAITGGAHEADISAIEEAQCDIEVEAGELRLTGLETNFGSQGANPAFATLSTYVSREAAGTVTALVPGEVDGTAKWLNVLSSAAGILNNIEGDDGNVNVHFPGTGAAFAGVDMDLGNGYNTLRFNGADLGGAGTILNVQRLISVPSSVGSFERVLNYDLSEIEADLQEVLINPLSTDGEVTYTNAMDSLGRLTLVPGLASFGYEIDLVSLSYANSPADEVTIDIRKATTTSNLHPDGWSYFNRNLGRIGELFVDTTTLIFQVDSLTAEEGGGTSVQRTDKTTLELLKGDCIAYIELTGPGNLFIEDLENGVDCLQHILLTDTFTGELTLGSAFDGIPVMQVTPIFNIDRGTYHDTIQDAINAAAIGDTIEVAAGTYSENYKTWVDIELYKSVNLVGAGSGQTIIELTGKQHGLAIRPDATGEVLVEGITFTKPDGAAKSADWAIIVGETGGTFQSLALRDVEVFYGQARNIALRNATYIDVVIDGIKANHAGAWGMSARGTIHDMSVTDSQFNENGWDDPLHGIGFDIDMPIIVNHLTVANSVFNNNARKGINLVKTSNATFTDIIANNNGFAGHGGHGVSLWEWSGTSQDLTFINPTLTGNQQDGLLIGSETGTKVSNVVIEGGTILNNGRGGLFVYRAAGWGEGVIEDISITGAYVDNIQSIMPYEVVIAVNNWWGSTAGPGEDKVVGDVDFVPWCGDAECTFFLPDEDGEIELPEDVKDEEIQQTINNAPSGTTIIIPAGTFNFENDDQGFVIDKPDITIILSDGTIILNSSPCFTVTADNTTITFETVGSAVCFPTDGSPGVLVEEGLENIIIEGFVIDGSEGDGTNDGILFEGDAVEDVIVRDILFRELGGDAIHFVNAPLGYVEIKGNLFLQDGFAVNVLGLDMNYNAFGKYDGPELGVDLPADYDLADYENWTHVELYLVDTDGVTIELNEVLVTVHPTHDTITYEVTADLRQAFGAEFVLEFDPDYLLVVGQPTLGTVFTLAEDLDAIVVDNVAGTITFNAGATTQQSGKGLVLFTVTFEGQKAGETELEFDDGFFAMNPGDGTSSLNIYASDLADGEVLVRDHHTVVATVQMQGRTVRSGVTMTLTAMNLPGFDPVYGPFEAVSTAPISNNVSMANVVEDEYEITVEQLRYLDITSGFTVDVDGPLFLNRLELRGGDLNHDQTVGIGDASVVGSNYGATGDNPGDANFDGIVNIFDLAMVGGNFGLQSHSPEAPNFAYAGWAPVDP